VRFGILSGASRPEFVGINAAKEFGGTPAMGGLAGILILNPEIANISFLNR
jgi:phosphotransferase system  glucose/maltose/N-acetylglucosamine-specific IIC component